MQKQNDRYIGNKKLLKSYVELQKRLGTLEENFSMNGPENNQNFYKWNLLQTTQKKYSTNKTDVYQIEDFWTIDIIDLKDYGPENNRMWRYILVEIDSFSKLVWTIPLKNKNALE